MEFARFHYSSHRLSTLLFPAWRATPLISFFPVLQPRSSRVSPLSFKSFQVSQLSTSSNSSTVTTPPIQSSPKPPPSTSPPVSPKPSSAPLSSTSTTAPHTALDLPNWEDELDSEEPEHAVDPTALHVPNDEDEVLADDAGSKSKKAPQPPPVPILAPPPPPVKPLPSTIVPPRQGFSLVSSLISADRSSQGPIIDLERHRKAFELLRSSSSTSEDDLTSEELDELRSILGPSEFDRMMDLSESLKLDEDLVSEDDPPFDGPKPSPWLKAMLGPDEGKDSETDLGNSDEHYSTALNDERFRRLVDKLNPDTPVNWANFDKFANNDTR